MGLVGRHDIDLRQLATPRSLAHALLSLRLHDSPEK
jgi:hypothetical protein